MPQLKFLVLFALLVAGGGNRRGTPGKAGETPGTGRGPAAAAAGGENLFQASEQLAVKEKIPAASISGMDFVNIKFGVLQ